MSKKKRKIEEYADNEIPGLGMMRLLKLPLTKAGWLSASTWPDLPEFPLDAELLAEIPEELPGEIPKKREELP